VPGIDHAVHDAGAPPERREPRAQGEAAAQPAAHGQGAAAVLAVDEEAQVPSHSPRPAEVAPPVAVEPHLERAPREGIGGAGGKGEEGLGEEPLVARGQGPAPHARDVLGGRGRGGGQHQRHRPCPAEAHAIADRL